MNDIKKIKKVLIANRGEIAVRIIKSLKEMDIKSVVVYSDADKYAKYVRMADESYNIGPAPSAESYLVIDKIINAAKISNSDAIHPGYGFLSENAIFSDRLKEEGIIFIGPSSKSITMMGDKITARKVVQYENVPTVPGSKDPIVNIDNAIREAKKIGFPVIIKASAGGGGKGMRVVYSENEMKTAIEATKREAASSFANDLVYMEKYLEEPHHIEFQILADTHGNIIHLYERECSVQRRHQKVLEESPSPFIDDELRHEMGKVAINVAKSCNYVGAGTIEFLVDKHKNFYFLEMNTRLQVEHPVTEMVLGIDLVKQQIKIAQGEILEIKQESLHRKGHAVECRIYAEDPENGFIPSPGKILYLEEPTGRGVRNDTGVYSGAEVPLYYDPMISKLITWGENRFSAIKKMESALEEYRIIGIKTNIPILLRILKNEVFIKGCYDTHFFETHRTSLFDIENHREKLEKIAAAIYFAKKEKESTNKELKTNSNWKTIGRMSQLKKF